MREIVLDTETTGMDPKQGHRIIEIGCIELKGHVPTGQTWHYYLNPERTIDAGAVAVHGLTNDFLKDKPTFDTLVDSFVAFIGDAPLIIHNAEFDLKFLNAELVACGFQALSWDRVTDTLKMARHKFPGSPASLDALCKRFAIDNTNRTLHGALLDARLLADVYLELIGGRQTGLALDGTVAESDLASDASPAPTTGLRPPRHYAPTPEEHKQHHDLIKALGSAALWHDYEPCSQD